MNRFVFKRFIVLLLVISACVSSCMQDSAKSTATVDDVDSTKVISSEEDRLLHYWDDFEFGDTLSVRNPDIGEQKLVDFIAVFPKVTDTIRTQAVKQMLSKAKRYPVSLKYFAEQYEHYLYDPNSPMRNDSYYEPVLEYLVDSGALNEADNYRYTELLKLVKRNKVGEQAIDFEFELPEGNKSTLYNVDASFTLLFFYEPGCSYCETSIRQLQESQSFQQLIDKGQMAVLAIYALGDEAIWKDYQSSIPATWVNGFDRNTRVLSDALYDLKASPTIYLLDKDKAVVLKDTDMSRLALFFGIK